jgi:hypothetical protein
VEARNVLGIDALNIVKEECSPARVMLNKDLEVNALGIEALKRDREENVLGSEALSKDLDKNVRDREELNKDLFVWLIDRPVDKTDCKLKV